MNLFEFEDYKKYLEAQISENKKKHGYKGRLAEAAGCQRAYFSQVLNTHIHLTPDHAAGLAQFWRMTNDETNYFLELVNLARAFSAPLKKILEKKLSLIRDQYQSVSGRIKKETRITSAHQEIYYSSWHYSAIHILLTCSQYQTAFSLSERLFLPVDVVDDALLFLEKAGMAIQKANLWKPASFDLHLPKESPLTQNNHLNWRLRSLQNSISSNTGKVHYTAVYSLSEKDFEMLKSKILNLISESRDFAIKSKEEDAFVLCCDFFRV